VLAVAGSFLLQLSVIYVPFMQRLFSTQHLGLIDLVISIALGSAILWLYEIKKAFSARRRS